MKMLFSVLATLAFAMPTPGDYSVESDLRITSATNSNITLTHFKGTSNFQCGEPSSDDDKVAAVNPRLFGVTDEEWVSKYAKAQGDKMPWCGRSIQVTVHEKTETFKIMEACQPCDGKECGSEPPCIRENAIDIWNGNGTLIEWIGNDYYQGKADWKLI